MKTEKRFNYNDIELVRIIADKVREEEKWKCSLEIFSVIDNYDYSKRESKQKTIEKIKIGDWEWNILGDWEWNILIEDRKEIYINTEYLKDRIRNGINYVREKWNKRTEEQLRIMELEEKKKREFQENFDKLTPEMKAFFYVATALGVGYLQACNNQNNYAVQNPYYHNNLLNNFLL